MGKVDKYAGYLYCGECGSRLYLRQGRSIDPATNNYSCSGHSKRMTDCTAHYIRAVVLDEIVLAALRKVTAYAREHADEFYAKVMSNGETEAKKRLKESERLRAKYNSRLSQLDSIIRTLYEDRVIGRITPERYDQLAAVYENEQADIKAKLSELEERIDTSKLREECVNEFIAQAKEYVEMQTVTPELLRVFIRRIDVWEKEVKYSRTCGNRIDICFTFLPEASTTIKGECIELLPAHAAKTQNPEG